MVIRGLVGTAQGLGLVLGIQGCMAGPRGEERPAILQRAEPVPGASASERGGHGAPRPERIARSNGFSGVASAGDVVFVGDESGVLRIDSLGRVSRFVSASRIKRVAAGQGRVYWARWSDKVEGVHEIYVSPISYPAPTRLATGDCDVLDMAAMGTGVYVAANCASAPRWVPLSGVPRSLPPCGEQVNVLSVAADSTRVVWTGDESVCVWNAGSSTSESIPSPQTPMSVGIGNDGIYWASGSTGSDDHRPTTVWAAARAGGAPVPLARGLGAIFAFAVDEKYLYFLEEVGRLGRVRHGGGTVETLASSRRNARYLGLTPRRAFWAVLLESAPHQSGELWSVGL